MNLTGKIKDGKEVIIGANVYVSDKNGKIILPSNGTSSDVAGGYTLRSLKPEDYVTVSFVGYGKKTIQMKSLGSGITIHYNFDIKPASTELNEFAVVETIGNSDNSARMSKNKKALIIGGSVVLAIGIGYGLFKLLKK